MDLLTVCLVAAGFSFAVSIGAHYTGACMGMPYAAGALRLGPALWWMAPLTFLGALLASERVETTVGHGLLLGGPVVVGMALAIIVGSLVLTAAYNFLRLPTSTIQIFVFATVGTGVAAGLGIDWATISVLLVLWAIAPFVAFGLGFLVIRTWDRWRPRDTTTSSPARLAPWAVYGLVGVGGAASFAMGANDVSNASGSFVMTGLFTLVAAGAIGGAGLFLGVVTWGRPLLQRVAFDIVRLDPRMAISAQIAQSIVILGAVTFGFFTSMNQALVGAMIGVGLARGEAVTRWATIRGILYGWGLGPISGFAAGYGFLLLFRALGAL